jgi:hypothetical protein
MRFRHSVFDPRHGERLAEELKKLKMSTAELA